MPSGLSIEQQNKGMTDIFKGQAWGMLLMVLITQTPIPALYALKLGATKLDVFVMFTMFNVSLIISIPVSWYLDLHPKQPFLLRWWIISNIAAIGIILAPYIGLIPIPGLEQTLIVELVPGIEGSAIHKIGGYFFIFSVIAFFLLQSVGGSAWFPLLKDIVPASKTGHFFSRMRFFWQSTGFLFVILVTIFVKLGGESEGALWQFQLIFLFAIATLWLRTYYISKLPEPPFTPAQPKKALWLNIRIILRNHLFKRFAVYNTQIGVFNSYIFLLLTFFVVDLEFSDSLNILIVSIGSLGTLIGLLISGIIMQRFGSKKSFKYTHFIRIAMFILIFFAWDTGFLSILVCILFSFINGFINAIFGVANTVKLFQIAPRRNRTLFIAMIQSTMAIFALFPPIIIGVALEYWLPLRIPIAGIPFYVYHLLMAITALLVAISIYWVKRIPEDDERTR